MDQNELMHYGVLGMKWGVRKNPTQAYAKASRKRQKLENRVVKAKTAYDKATVKANTGKSYKHQKLQAKASRLQYKADKKKYGLFSNPQKAEQRQWKADKAQFKADKYKAKHETRVAKAGKKQANYIKAQRKAEKWVKAMDKSFRDIDIASLSSEKISYGEDFVKRIA